MDAGHTSVVPARVGLVGNPSDGYGGAVIAAPIDACAASVTAYPSDRVSIIGGGATEQWPSPSAFAEHVTAAGHVGPQRLLTAALRRVADHVGPAGGVEVHWSTDIPRSVGLAGSSALVVAAIESVLAVWGEHLDQRVVAALALRAETDDLGIAAGWQDRIVQAVRSPVLVDTASFDRCGDVDVPVVRRVRPVAPLVVGWLESAADESGTYHAGVRARSEAQHPRSDVWRSSLTELGDLARRAADAADADDRVTFAALADRTWSVRQSVVPLRADHTELVESVRRLGVAATTPGSGGSVVAVPLDDETVGRVTRHLDQLGATWFIQE